MLLFEQMDHENVYGPFKIISYIRYLYVCIYVHTYICYIHICFYTQTHTFVTMYTHSNINCHLLSMYYVPVRGLYIDYLGNP